MILFTAGRFRVCCSRSNTAGDRNKQSPTREPPAKAGGYAQGRIASSWISASLGCLEPTKPLPSAAGAGQDQPAAPSTGPGQQRQGSRVRGNGKDSRRGLRSQIRLRTGLKENENPGYFLSFREELWNPPCCGSSQGWGSAGGRSVRQDCCPG